MIGFITAALSATTTAVGVTHDTHAGCAKKPEPVQSIAESAAIGLGAALLVAGAAWAISGKETAKAALWGGLIGLPVGGAVGFAFSEYYPFPSHRSQGTHA